MLLSSVALCFYIDLATLDEAMTNYRIVDSFMMTQLLDLELELMMEEVLGTMVYKGVVKDKESNVHMVQHSDHVSGMISMGENDYRLDALNSFSNGERQMVFYNTKDLKTKTGMPCLTGNHDVEVPYSLPYKMAHLMKRQSSTKACTMNLLADNSFAETYGNDAKSKMIEAVGIASDLYVKLFNIKLEAANAEVLTSASLAINQASSIEDILNAFSREGSGSVYGAAQNSEQYCLSHLFTSRDFGVTTGLAYAAKIAVNTVGGICDGTTNGGSKSLNVGVSTTKFGDQDLSIPSWHSTVIHEISHNFGASHDEDTSCYQDGFIMSAVTNAVIEKIPDLSQCSITDIKKKISSVTCFTEITSEDQKEAEPAPQPEIDSPSEQPADTQNSTEEAVDVVSTGSFEAVKPEEDTNSMYQRLFLDLKNKIVTSVDPDTLQTVLSYLPADIRSKIENYSG